MLDPHPSPERDRVVAMIVARILYPGFKLSTAHSLAEERARKREELLAATEARLEKIAVATRRESNRLSGQARIGLRAGKAIGLHKMGKHFELVIGDDSFEYRRKSESIAAEAALDGLYVIRTSLPEERMGAEEAVRAYKGLSRVERAFRSLKSVDLKLRPVYHYSAERVRAHVLLCMLAYYVEWHMRERLKPLLFADEETPAKVSESARRKASRKRGAGGLPAQSFRSLLHDLASLSRIRVEPLIEGAPSFETLDRPSASHREAFRLLGLRLGAHSGVPKTGRMTQVKWIQSIISVTASLQAHLSLEETRFRRGTGVRATGFGCI